MYTQEPKRVLAVVNDLFFSVKISEAAKRNGLALEFVKESAEVLAKAKQKPSLIVFDLNFDAVEPLKLITDLKWSAQEPCRSPRPARLPFAPAERAQGAGAGRGLRHGSCAL